MPAREIIVGIISDTHGLLRREAVAALRSSDMIIHAGDVGNPDVIKELAAIAPTHVVRGNIDTGSWAARLPMTELVDVAGRRFHVVHQISQLKLDPADAGFAAVVFGHSHKPLIETREGTMYLNPGSAGPRRFSLPVSVARVRVNGGEMRPEIVKLEV